MLRENRLFRLIVFSAALYLSLPIFLFAQSPDREYEMPVETLAEQRVDIQAVLMALAYNLQGVREKGIGPVMFDENFDRLSDETGLLYTEFKLAGAAITKDISLLDDENYRELSAILEFVDPGMRTAFVDVTANYYLGKELIFLEKADAAPLYMDRNQVQLYFLPSKDLPSLSDMTQMGYPELVEMIWEHALKDEDLKSLSSGRMNRLRVIAINRCRREPGVNLSLSIIGDDDENMAVASKVKAWSPDGWPVIAADGFFILNTEPGFRFEVSQTKEQESKKTMVLIDQFPSIFTETGHAQN